ncbi:MULTISPECIES: hypothetical protein [unclassified Microcoleus]
MSSAFQLPQEVCHQNLVLKSCSNCVAVAVINNNFKPLKLTAWAIDINCV